MPALIGCEAAYLFPADIDVCLSDNIADGDGVMGREREHGDESGDDGSEEEGEEQDGKGVGITRTGSVPTLGVDQEKRAAGGKLATGGIEDEGEEEEEKEWTRREQSQAAATAAGNLVMHIRSGDIFVVPPPFYGQVRVDF